MWKDGAGPKKVLVTTLEDVTWGEKGEPGVLSHHGGQETQYSNLDLKKKVPLKDIVCLAK